MKRTVFLLISVLLIMTAVTGCSMLEGLMASPDIILRIETFQATLNSPVRSAELIADNFAPAPTTAYADQILEDDFWDIQFDPYYDYNFEVGSTLDVTAVEATMTASYTDSNGDTKTETPVDVTFKMFKDDNGEWLIEEYWENGTAIVKYIEQ